MGVCPADASNFRLAGSPAAGSPAAGSPADSIAKKKQCFLESARHEATFVREATNKNDHPAIVGYFDAVGMNVRKLEWQGRAYCGAFIGAMMKRCGIKNPITGPAMTVNWLRDKTRVTRVKAGTVAQPGDIAGYNFSGRKTGIDHVEIVSNWHPNPGFPYTTVIGANTSAPKSAGNRQGVWVKDRLKRQVVWIIKVLDQS